MQLLTIILFALLAALQAGDAYLTWQVLANGGRELNPLVRLLMGWFGVVPALAMTKVALLAVAGLWLLDQHVPMLLLVGLYAWVVWHNWLQLQHAHGARQGS